MVKLTTHRWQLLMYVHKYIATRIRIHNYVDKVINVIVVDTIYLMLSTYLVLTPLLQGNS